MSQKPSSLVYVMGSSVIRISLEEDVHQGDPLGPALKIFAAVLQLVVIQLQKKFDDVTFVAFLDDIFVVGQLDRPNNKSFV